jgi:DNA-binding NtrC family response regulator
MKLSEAIEARPSPGGPGPESQAGKITRELLEIYISQNCLIDRLCLKSALERIERDIIMLILEKTNGNQRRASDLLGIKPTTLHYKMHRMGITPVHRFTSNVPSSLR